jgi:hypothetical protein
LITPSEPSFSSESVMSRRSSKMPSPSLKVSRPARPEYGSASKAFEVKSSSK